MPACAHDSCLPVPVYEFKLIRVDFPYDERVRNKGKCTIGKSSEKGKGPLSVDKTINISKISNDLELVVTGVC